jgi:hypothetical protein
MLKAKKDIIGTAILNVALVLLVSIVKILLEKSTEGFGLKLSRLRLYASNPTAAKPT